MRTGAKWKVANRKEGAGQDRQEGGKDVPRGRKLYSPEAGVPPCVESIAISSVHIDTACGFARTQPWTAAT